MKSAPKMYPDIPVVSGALPILGHIHHLITNPNRFYSVNVHASQPLAWVNHGFGKWSILVSGDAVDVVLKNKISKSGDVDATSADLLKNTVVQQDGAEHRRVRGAINGPFSPKGLTAAGVIEVINEVFAKGVDEWPAAGEVNIGNCSSHLTLQIIMRIIGVAPKDLEEWGRHFRTAALGNFNLPKIPYTPSWWAARSIDWLGARIRELIDEAKKSPDSEPTMLNAMVKATDEDGKKLSNDELVKNLRLLGFAGHETTAGVIAFMMVHYARQPELWDRLLAEVRASESDLSSPAELKWFPFAEAMFRESLRLNPPVSAIFRKLTEDVEIHGHRLPKDTEVHVSLSSRSWDPVKYPDPHHFKPERWLNAERSPGASESIQFGGGPHFCVGYHMAIVEGVWFAVYAARVLSKAGLRPAFIGDIKLAVAPLNNLARNTTIQFVSA